MLSGMCYLTGKKTRTCTGMVKSSNPHVGMGFFSREELELTGAGMERHYPTVSTHCHLYLNPY
jgi:hypothetical protein